MQGKKAKIRLKMVTKLFLALMLSSGAILISMAVFLHWSLGHTFSDYLDREEINARRTLIERLQDEYAVYGWERLRDNPKRWAELRQGTIDGPPLGRPFPGRNGDKTLKPRAGDAPPGGDAWQAMSGAQPPPGGPPRGGPPLGPSAGSGPPPGAVRLVVLDADKRAVMGPPMVGHELIMAPILSQGRTVGYLGINAERNPLNHSGYNFVNQLYRRFYGAAAVLMVLAAVVAFLLASHFSRPIKELAKAAHGMASGNYDRRVQVDRGDELGRLAHDFNFLATTLEHNQKARQRWIADISHELRTPLAVMRGELEAIQDGVRRPDMDSVNSLHHEVLVLAKIVNDLYELSLSDMGALNYKKETLHPNEVLDAVLHLFSPRVAQRQLTLEHKDALPRDIGISGDRQRLTQLFSNLLENSCRYTNAGGIIRITAATDDDHVVITLEDSPPGVAPEMLPRLFDRLFRAEISRSRKFGGAGLGLAICKNIVEAHEGFLEAKHASLGGLAVEIRFPVEQWTWTHHGENEVP